MTSRDILTVLVSPFFRAAFGGGFIETAKQSMTLPEDDPVPLIALCSGRTGEISHSPIKTCL